MLNGTNYGGIV